MAILKGGRGNKAPYESTHVRVPTPIKPAVEALIERFRLLVVEEGLTTDDAATTIESQPQADCYSRKQIIEAAKCGLRSKKGAWKSTEKMLTALFDEEVNISDL
jgi:hypothetical protein